MTVKHLYVRLYLAFVGILLSALFAAALLRHFDSEESHERKAIFRGVAQLIVEQLPPGPPEAISGALAARSEQLGLALLLYDRNRALIASSTGEPMPFPERHGTDAFWHERSPGLLVQIPDGRWVAALFGGHRFASGSGFLLGLALFAAVVAAGCYPLSRSITRRLEHLQRAAERWGSGQLSARSDVSGKDEVAQLASSFNTAAERVEELLSQRTRILASASHELRSPLARLRMALELLPSATERRRVALATEATKDAEELNELIEDLLITARSAPQGAFAGQERVNLSQLVASEAARVGADAGIQGDLHLVGHARTLRRLCRNLLDNAYRHGRGDCVRVELRTGDGEIRLEGLDRGPGLPEAEQERIFEPFYRPPGHSETEHGGVGLGLSLVRQIALGHGGGAHYQPRSGGGSRFVVQLGPPSPEPEPRSRGGSP